MASNIRITFLGTGGSMPKPGRSLPAVAIQVDDILNLFDCGEGTQKQFMKSGVSFMSLSNIFISHFHATDGIINDNVRSFDELSVSDGYYKITSEDIMPIIMSYSDRSEKYGA